MSVSIIVPAYNEESQLASTVKKYLIFFSNRERDFEIIIVTDGCTDNTPKIAEDFSGKYSRIKHLDYPQRLGKGGGIIQGIRNSSKEMVGFIDADGATEPREFEKLTEISEKIDGAIGSRWKKGTKILKKRSLTRRFLSRLQYVAMRILLGLDFKDTQCGAKIFKKSVLNEVIDEIKIEDFCFDTELLYRLKNRNFEMKEVPITWSHKGKSSLNTKKAALDIALSILEIKLLNLVPRGKKSEKGNKRFFLLATIERLRKNLNRN